MKNNKQAQVFHFDLFGKRQDKYDFLENHSIGDIKWNELQPDKPSYFFIRKNYSYAEKYNEGLKVDEFFPTNSVGIVTSKDEILIGSSKEELTKQVEFYYNIIVNKSLIQRLIIELSIKDLFTMTQN